MAKLGTQLTTRRASAALQQSLTAHLQRCTVTPCSRGTQEQCCVQTLHTGVKRLIRIVDLAVHRMHALLIDVHLQTADIAAS